ncbi:hypothetical protein AAHE18_18G133800 [Arachis hypogaea]
MSATPLSSHERHLSPLKYECKIITPLFSSAQVFLSDWWLAKPCLPLQGLAVGGIAYGLRERMFLSTVIAKRHEANVLETEDGVTLHLNSFINSSRSSQNGFPRKVCKDFLLGFPDDWQKYTAHSFGAKCDDCENGVLVAAPVSQVGNPNNNRSLTGVFDRNPCKVHSEKSMVGSPVSTTKIRATQSLGDCKEEHVSQTRKYSKKSLMSLKETSTCPVRRSPRLSKATK